MVQSLQKHIDALNCCSIQSQGDSAKSSNGLSPNAEAQQHAIHRYQRQLRSDPQLQEHVYDQAKVDWLKQSCHTSIQLLQGMCSVYAQRPMFGFCEPGSDQWRTMSYRQAYERLLHFAAGMQAVGAYKREDFVGICGFSSLDWVTADFANTYCGATSVPVPLNIQAEDIVTIINEAELACLICSLDELGSLSRLIGGCPAVKTLIVMDLPLPLDAEAQVLMRETQEGLKGRCRVYTLPDILARGEESPLPKMVVPGQDGVPKNPIFSLFYTSGSTGLPKGAIYTEEMWLRYVKNSGITSMPIASITLGFLPLNHVLGRLSINQSLMSGGSVWFIRKSDMSTFFDDVKAVRPTAMMLIPRLANMMYDQAHERLRGAQEQDKQAVIESFRDKEMGGRVYACMVGSAPSAPEVVHFLRAALGAPILESFGSTETGMIARSGMIGANVTEWKLVDVPELGYYTTDKPFPRGELHIKTKAMIPGYYKQQWKWEEMLRDGFMEMGDVMELRGPNHIVWIDRKKNIMKLSQGEFVATGRLEATYSGSSDLIQQMYIYGSARRSYLLAVIVASKVAISRYSSDELKKALRRDIDDLARTKALQGYEIPRDFIVDTEPFSKANHLLTDSSKPARGNLKAKYGPILEEMYAHIEQRQRERQDEMRRAAPQGTIRDKVKEAAALTLGVEVLKMGDSSSSFTQLGGDSLAAIQFARRVDDLCGTHLPVSFVLDHSHSMADIVTKVEDLLKDDEPDAITFESMHGRSSNMIQARDLDLHRFAPRDFPAGPTTEIAHGELPAEPEKVLLTGANGFLGRFLLLDFLQRVSTKKTGYVVAVVRGSSDSAAYARLRASYDSDDPELLQVFDNLARTHLKVYAGDLSKPCLRLAPEVYRELAQSLDTIIHNGALVNHAFTYEQLFEPNVLGSLEVMKLAVQHKRKALTFISSVGVAAPLGITDTIYETSVGADLAMEFPAGGGYAYGYGCSKWATEVQLQQLHREFGVPVSVFRCGMILAHSRYLGQQNPTDMFTRLLASLFYTGVAPESFYSDPSCPNRHYDGAPVDFMAGVIAGIASAQRRGLGLYHAVNPHWDDNVSLDSFLGWIQNAGFPLERISDYAQWYQKFKAALEKLDSDLASKSSLPTVYQWERPISGPIVRFDATSMRERLLQTTSWKAVPHLDEAFIRQNMKNLVTLRIIGPPGQLDLRVKAPEP